MSHAESQRQEVLGPRYLRYLSGLLLLLALAERSELLSSLGVAILVGLTLVIAIAGLGFALRRAPSTTENPRNPDHYLVPALAIIVAAGVSYLSTDWRLHAGGAVLMALAVFMSSYVTLERFLDRERPGHQFLHDAAVIIVLLGGYLAILSVPENLWITAGLIFALTGVVALETFYLVTQSVGRSAFAALFVAQVVFLVAFTLLSTQVITGEGYVTVVLMLAWYFNRGLAVHFFTDSLSARVVAEYTFFGLLAAAFVTFAFLNR